MKLDFAKAHKRLWTWIAENPVMDKYDWPEWKWNGGKIPEIENNCFACEAYYRVDADNEVCPIAGGQCNGGRCFGLYWEWRDEANSARASKLAAQIAAMAWHGKRVFEVEEGE